MASLATFYSVFKPYEKRYGYGRFAQKQLLEDTFNYEICYRYDYLIMDLVSYNLGSNRARNFKSASRFALVRFWNYSRDYSLNCTPLGPITITNNAGMIYKALTVLMPLISLGRANCSKTAGEVSSFIKVPLWYSPEVEIYSLA